MEIARSGSQNIVNSDVDIRKASTIKFLCSYGGKILPRYPDGKLRYHGGETRVLSVDRSISFGDLMQKLQEMCGPSIFLRCQLPDEDLDSLISITTDEDLGNLIEEYDFVSSSSLAPSSSLKIRAFISVPKPSNKTISSPPSSVASSSASSSSTTPRSVPMRIPMAKPSRCLRHQVLKQRMFSGKKPDGWKVPLTYYQYNRCAHYAGVDRKNHTYQVHTGKQWQEPMF